jgi:alpha/beta superfamily hydrolase
MLTVKSSGDARIEVAIQSPNEPTGTVVICHPHPIHGGSMRHPILAGVADEAVAGGFAAIRFNFRGVGGSTGSHTGGPGEVDDLASVMDHAARESPPVVGIAGWSFGAAIALAWQADTHSTLAYAGVAPPMYTSDGLALPEAESLRDAQREFIIGERDQFVDADELTRYAESIGAAVNRYQNTDHFFVNKYERLSRDVVAVISR